MRSRQRPPQRQLRVPQRAHRQASSSALPGVFAGWSALPVSLPTRHRPPACARRSPRGRPDCTAAAPRRARLRARQRSLSHQARCAPRGRTAHRPRRPATTAAATAARGLSHPRPPQQPGSLPAGWRTSSIPCWCTPCGPARASARSAQVRAPKSPGRAAIAPPAARTARTTAGPPARLCAPARTPSSPRAST